MFDYNCCHRRQRLVCPNMTTAKRKLVLVMCCACICSCAAGADAHATAQQQLFGKYAGDNGFMTVQNFEDLMLNLGLMKTANATQAQHDTAASEHHQSEPGDKSSAAQLQQIDTNRPLNQDAWNQISHPDATGESVNRCLSTSEIIGIMKNNDGNHHKPEVLSDVTKNVDSDNYITPNAFLDLCSALIYKMDKKYCYSDMNSIKYGKMLDERNVSKQEQRHAFDAETDEPLGPSLHLEWLYASISVLIISASGLIGIAVVPFARSPSYPQLLRFLVALAVGTLCGDALMHLLPHALMPHGHGHAHISIMDHHESHNIPMYKCGLTFLTVLIFYALESLLPIFNKGMQMHNHGHTHEMKPELGSMLTGTENNSKKQFSPIALMIILGDALHNLTDGLAIGAAFSNDPVTGLATSIAVLCHELPHEFGDFAVLLRAGYSVKRVIYFNVMSSLLSFIGMAIGLLLASGHAAASQWIYAATAGSFLYIALADLVPEMSEGNQKVLSNVLLQVGGIILGGVIMLLIALNEDSLRSLFS